jgi:hypothetical protein
MSLKPVVMMLDRVDRARSDSDTALFHDLMYAGEFVVKLTTAAFVASIDNDRDSHRYRLLYSLIRSDGIGDWSRLLDDALAGPASHNMAAAAKEADRRAFTERLGSDTWQHEAVRLLVDVLRRIDQNIPATLPKVALRAWFSNFAELRNKARGHGAPTAALCSNACPDLEKSVRLLCTHNPIFARSWAYLHRNLSGKYHVVNLGGDDPDFSNLKTADARSLEHYSDGVYIKLSIPRRVELVHTDRDVSDFFFPNGAFNGKRYELHSLITDNRMEGDASPYLASASGRPQSETHGLGKLDVIDKVWSNLPSVPSGYVKRPRLEREIVDELTTDRHPIVTLVGRGGIGKTSLALTTLHSVAAIERYFVIIWFSARDIDLFPSGPKVVKLRY